MTQPSYNIEYLACAVRHNTSGEVTTVRFLLKANDEYQTEKRYFLAVGAYRAGGSPDLIEFSCLDRAYDDQNAQRLARLRGTLTEPKEYLTKGVRANFAPAIKTAVKKFFWLSDRFVPATLAELVGEKDLNLDDADTISELNLSQCSGDTESDLKTETLRNILGRLGFKEPEDERCDKYYEMMIDLEAEALNSETTLRMLVAKYPEQKEELEARHLEVWREKTAELRAKFA